MSEAEKKWAKFDNLYEYRNLVPEDISSESREAYKAALRRDIEKRLDELDEYLLSLYQSGDEDNAIRIGAKIAELKITLELLDTVEP